MKIIDDMTYRALLDCREKFASNVAMAAAFGLSPTQIGKVLRRRASHFDDTTWTRIAPLLAPYIKPSVHCRSCNGCPHAGECLFRQIVENLLAVPPERQEEWFRLVNDFISANVAKFNR